MNSIFSVIVECILEEVIRSSPAAQSYMLSLFEKHAAPSKALTVYQSVPLMPIAYDAEDSPAKLYFDGGHKLDLCLLIEKQTVIPLEVKVGNEIPQIKECGISHKGTRLSGNILGILDQRVDASHSDTLVTLFGNKEEIFKRIHVNLDGEIYPLGAKWGLIAPGNLIEKWAQNNSFHTGPVMIDIQKLLQTTASDTEDGAQLFNRLVANHLHSEDYFKDWILNGQDLSVEE
ncbi:hypothetical protein KF728_21235 [Candidatus Obscuribacterales bacterium]|nr:hypothetical protein [Candidatus Obscuribacterales bacterium]MBX3152695.1 hypothetical protein [Candidatus Obscuribacterales bacterium]